MDKTLICPWLRFVFARQVSPGLVKIGALLLCIEVIAPDRNRS
jgi:hypothetical protein